MKANAPAQPEALGKLADDFWAWRAKYAPFTADDVNRIERPGGLRDWSRASIDQRRKDLAAFEARYDGMELMGTEGAPDAFAEGGSFEMPDLAKERRSGAYQTIAYDKEGQALYDENGNPKMKSVPAFLKASAKEVQRLNRNKIAPDTRFHYRLIAGALAMKAAALLSDNSEELADVINQAGMWVKDRDEKVGNRYYQVLDHRCAKTKIGRADKAKHWFVDQNGPWSTAQGQEHAAMRKELKLDSSE